MDVQVVSSQGQSSGVKTEGAFLPRILLSGFLLVSVVGDSAFLGLQTGQKGNRSCLLCAERSCAEVPSQRLCPALVSCWGPRAGPPNLFTLLRELPRRVAGGTAAPATRVALATRVFPPVGDVLLRERPEFESVASSSSPRLP